jgi:dTDP-4-dehydrorhamnose reductase
VCARFDLPFVHYSTDYVFDGSGTVPHDESETPRPLNHYGESKLRGEQGVLEIARSHPGFRFLILRATWVYDESGKNFLRTILRLAHQKDELKIVQDQIGAPSYAGDLARWTLEALRNADKLPHFPSGIYHLAHHGQTSWLGFAEAILTKAKARHCPLRLTSLQGIPTSDYPTPARRPLNSRMNCTRFESTFGITLRSWERGLEECFSQISDPSLKEFRV